MQCPVVMGKIQCPDTILHLEVEKILVRERTWLLRKLANIHRHPWALGSGKDLLPEYTGLGPNPSPRVLWLRI